jgi:hypothetical protein
MTNGMTKCECRNVLPVAWIILAVCDRYLAIYINSVSTVTGITFWIVGLVYSLAVTRNTKKRKNLLDCVVAV